MAKKPSNAKRKQKSSKVTILAAAETEQAREARLWSPLQTDAAGAIRFWNRFLALRSGNLPLSEAQLQQLIRFLRAISWVETKHGTFDGGASHGKVDVIQCADTRNPWWTELTSASSRLERFISGPGRPNYWASQLPAAAAADPFFDQAAAISRLEVPANGSSDPNFKPVHSLYWGVPLLLQKMNGTAGSKTFQCGPLDAGRLLEGARAYNGGGDPLYSTKVAAALQLASASAVSINASVGLELSAAGHAVKPAVIEKPSPNHASRQGKTIQYLILHNTDASLKSALNELTDPATAKSAHYMVDRTGDIYQLVQDSETAWHAGNKPINQQSIGIEIVASQKAQGMTAKQQAALVALARFAVDAYDIPLQNVLPHRRVRIGFTNCPGWVWPTDAELDAWIAANLQLS